ncbi:hypothetical protein C6P40_002248 [Pichia californica]|uniref:Rhodanese domain-containing protein n=1 Tax=Pichia californica TaxID=460514 RepID=A0A9P7BGY1_9ASCO|nr:hypothetical protein C6P40_002248 [[Candida] californica]
MSAIQTTRSIIRITTKTNKSSIRYLRNFSLFSLRSNITNNSIKLNKLNKFNNMTTNTNTNNIRNYSVIENELNAPSINFDKMKEISNSNDSKYVIIDVREPDEFIAGHIPNAINIPCKSSPGALGLDSEEFKLNFGFDKPSTDKTLVFYCLAGVRARMSEELASTFGYENRLTYLGSFKDWLENNGKIEIPKSKKDDEEKQEKA